MKKHAFIISYPGEKGADNYCAGVLVDSINIKNFLMSPIGGAWQENEISPIENTTSSWLKLTLSLYKSYDYIMVFFSGHGYHNGLETILELSKGNTISESDLIGYTMKQLIILDCCRKVYPEVLLDHKILQLSKTAGADSLNPADCRKYYEKTIMDCGNTLTQCYSCQINEVSRDSSSEGGYYLSSLLKSAQKKLDSIDLDLSKDYRKYSINAIHQEATQIVKLKTSGKQNPSIDREKLETDFPFAILA